ncbi:MAG TPA: hypothetical protein VJQ54_16595 [Candidatus Sulfotelmatobacter sp.]|nr:hypothetical protein [Candidatus Sulfotelmatobacter sp.]
MRKQFCFTLLLIATSTAIAVAAQTANQGPEPSIGTWKLNLEKSDFGQAPKPKSERLFVSEASPTVVKWRASGVGADGKPMHISYAGAADGKPYPVKGSPRVNTIAYSGSVNDPQGVQSTMTMKDGSTVKQTITLSDDKNTMTAKSEGANGVSMTEVWERVRPTAKKAAAKKSE